MTVTVLDLLASVPIGVSAWQLVDPLSDAVPAGGHVWMRSTSVDPETGEVALVLHCVRIRGGKPSFCRLVGPEINVEALSDAEVNPVYVRDMVRCLCRALGAREGPWGSEDTRLLDVALRLAQVLVAS